MVKYFMEKMDKISKQVGNFNREVGITVITLDYMMSWRLGNRSIEII
jgi:hypothetical protein